MWQAGVEECQQWLPTESFFFSETAYTSVPIKYYKKINKKKNRNYPSRFSKKSISGISMT